MKKYVRMSSAAVVIGAVRKQKGSCGSRGLYDKSSMEFLFPYSSHFLFPYNEDLTSVVPIKCMIYSQLLISQSQNFISNY